MHACILHTYMHTYNISIYYLCVYLLVGSYHVDYGGMKFYVPYDGLLLTLHSTTLCLQMYHTIPDMYIYK